MKAKRWEVWGWGWVLLAWVLSAGCAPPENRLAGSRRELVMERLTEEALRVAPGAAVLTIGNPFAAMAGSDSALRAVEDASRRGVARAVEKAGGKLAGATVPALREDARQDPTRVPIPTGASTPISFMTERGAWDRIRSEFPGAGLWVSWVGLPADLAETQAWLETGGPKWALYMPDLRMVGTRESVREAFRVGKLAAVVLARPGAPPESESMVADARAEFDRRYVLVTRENWEEVEREWPSLLDGP